MELVQIHKEVILAMGTEQNIGKLAQALYKFYTWV